MEMSFWDEMRRKRYSLVSRSFKDRFSLIWKIWSYSNFLEAKEFRTPMTWKHQYFCWASINVCSSVSAKQQIQCLVSFLPWWEDCFFHQGQRQVTNWAVAASSIPLRWLYRRPPPSPHPTQLHSSKPPTYTPTHPCTGTHTNKCTLSPPLQRKAYSHIKSIKFTLLGLSHKKNISPLCSCGEETL